MNYLDQLLLLTVWTSNVARRKSYGDPPKVSGFLAKSLVIPAIYTKFKLKFVSDNLEFCIYGSLLYESPKDSLGKCFVLLSIGTHLMKL